MTDRGEPIGTVLKTSGRLFDSGGNNLFAFSTCGDDKPESFEKSCDAAFGSEWDYAGNFEIDDWCNGVFKERFPYCVKRRHNGDPTTCCLTGEAGEKLTCAAEFDGSLSPIPKTCSKPMDTDFGCRDRNGIGWDLNKPQCFRFAKENPTDSNVVVGVAAACSVANPPSWCRGWFTDPSSHGLYDDVMRVWCFKEKAAGRIDPLCACINAPPVLAAVGPIAYDPICIAETGCAAPAAYKTKANLIGAAGCPKTLCVVENNFIAGGNIDMNGVIKVEQNCGGSGSGGSGGSGSGGNTNDTKDTNDNTLTIVLFVMFLCVLLGGSAFYVRDRARAREKKNTSGIKISNSRSNP